ncbi:MAG: hypothetical protein R2712_17205, partial [Vicinamibacterales bacterium]
MRQRLVLMVPVVAIVGVWFGTALPTATPRTTDEDHMLAVQVFLDRARYSPGEIDGVGGANTDGAIDAFERATGQRVDRAVAAEREP